MKKTVALIFILVMIVGTGCSSKKDVANDSETKPVAQDLQIEEQSGEKEDTEKQEELNVEEPQNEEQEKAIVYYCDENYEVQNKVVSVKSLDEKILWQLLKDDGTVSEDSEVLSMDVTEGNKMQLDVNQAFGNQMRDTGTSGEYQLLQCVVNSYLTTFSCEEMMITEEGNTLVSDHAVYDEYLKIQK